MALHRRRAVEPCSCTGVAGFEAGRALEGLARGVEVACIERRVGIPEQAVEHALTLGEVAAAEVRVRRVLVHRLVKLGQSRFCLSFGHPGLPLPEGLLTGTTCERRESDCG